MKKANIFKAIGFCVVFLITASVTFFVFRDNSGKSNSDVKVDVTFDTPNKSESPQIIDSPKQNQPQEDTNPSKDKNDSVKVTEKIAELTGSNKNNDSSNKEEKTKIVLKSSFPVYNSLDGTYSFKASVNGDIEDSYRFELWSSKLVAKSKDGKFTQIPPIKGGKYKLCLVSETTNKNIIDPISVRGFKIVEKTNDGDSSSYDNNNGKAEPEKKEKPQKKLITEEDFQKRMLDRSDRSLDGGRRSPVAKTFRVVVVNSKLDDGSSDVSDIQDVRDMIHTYNKWKSARLVGLEYDEKGYVTLAKIEPIY